MLRNPPLRSCLENARLQTFDRETVRRTVAISAYGPSPSVRCIESAAGVPDRLQRCRLNEEGMSVCVGVVPLLRRRVGGELLPLAFTAPGKRQGVREVKGKREK